MLPLHLPPSIFYRFEQFQWYAEASTLPSIMLGGIDRHGTDNELTPFAKILFVYPNIACNVRDIPSIDGV